MRREGCTQECQLNVTSYVAWKCHLNCERHSIVKDTWVALVCELWPLPVILSIQIWWRKGFYSQFRGKNSCERVVLVSVASSQENSSIRLEIGIGRVAPPL